MQMSMRDLDGTRIIRVEEPRLDAACAIDFKDRCNAALSGTQGHAVLDLGLVEFIDSSGLGAVVAARKFLGNPAALHLAALRPAVQKVMQLTRMETVFPIHDTVDSALRAAESRVG